jgi:membrane protease subunit (stomatin/prohibitin family)
MARTAVIAGTATAVSGRVREGQMNREMAEQQPAAVQPEQPAAPAAAPSADGTDLVSQLQKLGELKASGVLSDAEFAEAKARLLA